MINFKLSDTYKALYYYIIEDVLFQILEKRKNWYFKSEEMPYIIGENYEKYKKRALKNMGGSMLDRHKLASCICGAIIESKPLVGINGVPLEHNANEVFALATGMGVIKFYMVYDLVDSLDISSEMRNEIIKQLLEKREMLFLSPDEKICDSQDYLSNLLNSLYWTHHQCDIAKIECFHYDIFTYSNIFYHLELYNKPRFKYFVQEYFEK